MSIFQFFMRAFTGKGSDGRDHDVHIKIGEVDLDNGDFEEVACKVGKVAEQFDDPIVGYHEGSRKPYPENTDVSDFPEFDSEIYEL